MRHMVYVVAAGLVILLAGLVPVLSQEGETPHDKWARLRNPGEQHKWLAQDVGNWEITGKLWVGPEETIDVKGDSTVKMIFDRYAHEEYTLGSYKGFGYLGYDNLNDEFQALYCGTSGTGMHILRGTLNADKTVLTLTGQWQEKALDGALRKQRVVITRKSQDESLVEMFESVGDHKEGKEVELTYKRKK